MKKYMYYSLILGSILLSGCNEKPTLYVYNWSDFIDEELVRQFEDENGCNVVIDAFDDNESMLAKMMAGATGYDIIVPSSYMIPTLVSNNLISALNTNLLPNVMQHLDWKYASVFHSDTLRYSIPYAFSATGIAYRKDKFKIASEKEQSWDVLKNHAFENRVCLLNDMREVIGIGLHKFGYSVNTKNPNELEQALSYAKSIKKCARKLDNVQYRTGLVSGEYYVAVGYTCDIMQVIEENADVPIDFFIPTEGSNCCWDEFAITRNAQQELAHKFIDFFYRAEVAAKNMKYICATVPNKDMWSFLGDAELKNKWLNFDVKELGKLELIQDVGDALEMYGSIWDRFISNK